jgi:hypothetical protein
MIAELDSGAEPVAGSIAGVGFDGSPVGAGVACGADACHVAASVATGDGGALEAFEWRPGADLRPKRLVSLGAPPRGTVAPVLGDDDIFYADESRAGDTTIRRIGVDWR